MMTHMSDRLFIYGSVAAALLFAGCDRAQSRASTADSLLSRDLTLATAPVTGSAPVPLGDTASNRDTPLVPPSSLASTPIASAAPPRPSPPPSQTQSPTTVAPVASSVTKAADPAPLPTGVLPMGTPIPPGVNYDAARASLGAGGASVASSGGLGARELAFGSVITGRSNGAICALANRPGDRLVIVTTADAFGSNGARLPAGSQIVVEMTQPEAGSQFSFRALSVQVDSAMLPVYGTVRVEGTPTERKVATEDNKGSVLGDAMKGAILGRILGGNKGAIIGAAGGVAVGTAAARRNRVSERCLPSGMALSVVLSAPLVLGAGAP